MSALRLLAAVMIVAATISSALADEKEDKADNAKLLLGKWEVIKAEKKDTPVGTVIEFGKDGKMKVTLKENGKEQSADAIYTVESDKIAFTLKLGEKKEKKDPLTIKKISEMELVVVSKTGTIELKRVK